MSPRDNISPWKETWEAPPKSFTKKDLCLIGARAPDRFDVDMFTYVGETLRRLQAGQGWKSWVKKRVWAGASSRGSRIPAGGDAHDALQDSRLAGDEPP